MDLSRGQEVEGCTSQSGYDVEADVLGISMPGPWAHRVNDRLKPVLEEGFRAEPGLLGHGDTSLVGTGLWPLGDGHHRDAQLSGR